MCVFICCMHVCSTTCRLFFREKHQTPAINFIRIYLHVFIKSFESEPSIVEAFIELITGRVSSHCILKMKPPSWTGLTRRLTERRQERVV